MASLIFFLQTDPSFYKDYIKKGDMDCGNMWILLTLEH